MNFEGCACPWCGYVTMVLLEPNDMSVIANCNTCGNLYKATPHPKYGGHGILMTKVYGTEEAYYKHSTCGNPYDGATRNTSGYWRKK